MKEKEPKSLQAVIVTLVVGMLLPKLVDLTGIIFVDKIIWKVVLTIAFNLATIIVGVLFSAKLINGRVEGGKARIVIFLIIVFLFLCLMPLLLIFIKDISKYIIGLCCGISLLVVEVLIVYYIVSLGNKKRKFRTSQEKSVVLQKRKIDCSDAKRVQLNNSFKYVLPQKIKNTTIDYNKKTVVAQKSQISSGITQNNLKKDTYIKLKTVYELWKEKDVSEKCLTITNNDNPDLKWIKIYKPPYKNGKFYGYIMMMNAHNTVNGEIYFANEPIWKLYNL